MMTRSIPTLAESRYILRLDQLVLNPGSEHPRLAPAPHFLPTHITHVEIMGLPGRKAKLDHPGRVVADVERKLHHSPRVHSELGGQRRFRSLFSGRCQGRLVPRISARKRNDGGCTQQGNDQSICHTTWRPAREIR